MPEARAAEGSRTIPPWAMVARTLGNLGDEDTLDLVEPYFSSPDANVRASAYMALVHMQDERAVGMVLSSLQEESNKEVRMAAMQAMSLMRPNEEGNRWVRWEALAATDTNAQVALAQMLGKAMKRYPNNEVTLRKMLEKDPPNLVKQTIYQYIPPQ